MDASSVKVLVAVIQDVPHILVRWPNGDISILNKVTDDLGSVNVMGIRGQLLKELRPLIGTFE